MSTKYTISAFSILAVAALALATGHSWPVTMAPNTTQPTGGEVVTFTLTYNQSDSTSTATTIYVSNSSAFSSIPTSVTLPANQTQVTFQGTVANGFVGSVEVTASANGQGVSRTLYVE